MKEELNRRIAELQRINEQRLVDEFRHVLRYQNQTVVDEFIEAFKKTPLLFGYYFCSSDDKPVPKRTFEQEKTAFLAIIQILESIDNGVIDYPEDIEGLQGALTELAYTIGTYVPLKTGGRRSNLASAELCFLSLLRSYFQYFFPTKSSNFIRGNLLHQLGAALLDKPIPDSVNQMLDKYEEFSQLLEQCKQEKNYTPLRKFLDL